LELALKHAIKRYEELQKRLQELEAKP
jgi:hypothetical protein